MGKKEKPPQNAHSLADLGKLVDRSALRPAQPSMTQAPGSRDASNSMPARIASKERAGRAPYNFVPLPPAARWLEESRNENPPTSDTYHGELETGVLHLEIEALTDFYIRGMQPLHAFAQDVQATLPFLVDGELRLPGSSLRGMTRSLVEILGESPLDPVNDQQLFFRAVAATNKFDPRRVTSFEPQAVAYKSRMQAHPASPSVQVGYLYGSRDRWYIQPAIVDANGRQWYRYRTEETWTQQEIWFKPAAREPWAEVAFGQRDGWNRGLFICSGGFQKKTAQWIITPEDDKASRVPIPDVDVNAYLEGGITRTLAEPGHGEFRYSFDFRNGSRGRPCFYVEWADSEGNRHVSFGHTHFFRLPYRHTTADAIPRAVRRAADEKRWDLAQAVFGRVSRVFEHGIGRQLRGEAIEGKRGRVAFEDAFLVSSPEPPYAVEVRSTVLGQPKPTTYQHYLIQRTDRIEDSIHWDGDKDGRGTAIVRGHKLYWHRPGAEIPPAMDQENVESLFQPAKAGARFRSRVRFENLRPWELGALLMALDLPTECAHRLGMGKPRGLGSFRIRVVGLDRIDHVIRYSSFLTPPPPGATDLRTLETGLRQEAETLAVRVKEFKNHFAHWLHSGATEESLWSEPRLSQLKALLTCKNLPAAWNAMTRYLEFGKVAGRDGRPMDYNEYQKTGYPDRIEPQPRRPLPPPTQVLKGESAIPTDERPKFMPAPKKSRASR